MIKDSSVIDPAQLDKKKAYIQITYVDPYFYQYEDDTKRTYFERSVVFFIQTNKYKFFLVRQLSIKFVFLKQPCALCDLSHSVLTK